MTAAVSPALHTIVDRTDVGTAVARAQAAFPAVSASTAATRAEWLRAVADALDDYTVELVALADLETALGVPRLTGEVARTSGQLRMFADAIEEGSAFEPIIDHARPDAAPPRPDLRRILVPLGPVAVFSASNFPFAFSVAGGDTASALAAGNPVIVKAHPGHPELSRRTADLVTAALASAGAPAGVFGLVEGFESGPALVQHPLIAAVGFTGSVVGGRALFDLASRRPVPIPFYGELGSINPVVVTPSAARSRGADLAAGLVGSFTLGAGQFCTKPGVVFVPADSSFVDDVVSALPPGLPHRLLSERIDETFHAGLERLRSVATEVSPTSTTPVPVVFAADVTDLADHADELFEECFGPAVVLLRYRDDEQLFGALARLEGSLTATLHTDESDDLHPLVTAVGRFSGRVLFGGWPTGVAVSPAQHHGGPYPASTSIHTSVGTTAIRRFLRPLVFQDAPNAVLPALLRDDNPLGVPRRVDGVLEAPGS